jgi:hypothetical protein
MWEQIRFDSIELCGVRSGEKRRKNGSSGVMQGMMGWMMLADVF